MTSARFRRILAGGWLPESRRLVAAAYLALGVLIVCLGGERRFRTSVLTSLLAPR